jgi:multiple sugar transport system ATP-binding protein
VAEVTFDEVDKTFDGDVRAVIDLTLEAHDGEFLVLVGPSGCGKTTALRMVAGLEEITDGTVAIGGRIVNDLTPKERDVAMVFQNYALYPHMSVAENIAFGLLLRKTSKTVIEERVRWAANMLDLTPYLNRRPKELSGGQRQRVAMGRAIVRQPQAFLMDEPLSNLDAKLRVQMRADIAKLQRDLGTTTLYVTHDQVEAMTMGDRVAVMNAGVLQQVDTPQRLFDRPANLFVAGFVGTPPMNLLEARLASSDGGVAIQLGQDRIPLSTEALARFGDTRMEDRRPVVLGIRADDLHRADRRADLPAIDAGLELIEALGSQSIAYFKVEAHAIGIEETSEAAEEGESAAGARANLAVSLPAEDAFGLRLGERMPVAVDTKRIHLFDGETGAPLRQP